MSLTKRTAEATKWSAIFSVLGQGVSFIVSVIMVRLLMPEDYGLFAIVIVVTGFLNMLQDIGMGAALVQRKEIEEDHKISAFWGMVVFGICLYTLIIIIMIPVSRFYSDPRIPGLMLIVGTMFIFNALITVHRSLLIREMNFKVLGMINIIAQILSSSVMIILALSGWGVWSLAIGSILFLPISIPMFYYKVRWFPRFKFKWHKVKELLGFGLNISGSKVVGFGRKNSDYMIIGRFLGSTQLGYYTLAYKLVTEPINRTCSMCFKVFLPAFSQVQDDDERLCRGYLFSHQYLMMIVLPITIGILVLSSEIVPTVFGKQWLPAIPLVQIMAIIGLVEILQNLGFSILYSKGRADIVFRYQSIMTVVLISVLLFVTSKGIIIVGWSVMMVSLLFYILIQEVINRKLKITWRVFLSNLTRPALISIIMGIFVYIEKQYLKAHNWSDLSVLIVCTMTGILFYTIGSVIFNRIPIIKGWRLISSPLCSQ